MTSPEPEEYILTPEEEKEIIENAIDSAKKHCAWKFRDMGLTPIEVEMKLDNEDWNAIINRDELLKRANSNKAQELWHREQRHLEAERERIKLADLKKEWTFDKFFRLMQFVSKTDYHKPLIINEDTTPLINTICLFMSGDPRFEVEQGYSLNKGLLIRGVSGVGKTHLIKCVAENDLCPIKIYSMLEIADQVKEDGDFEINLSANRKIYLDDVGTEEHIVSHYGTKINWFKNFIEKYYLKNYPFNNLIISTNNNFQELEEKYGFRVRSRIKEMFNIIDVKGVDLRK